MLRRCDCVTLNELTESDKKILSAIRNNPNQKRTKIADLTNIAWTTTTNSIDKLIEAGMVQKTGSECESDKKTLEIAENYAYFLGVSIGTSHIKISILDFAFNFVKKETILSLLAPTSRFVSDFWNNNHFKKQTNENLAFWCAETPSKGLLDVKKLINELCEFSIELNKKINILAIGFSFPGHIDNKNGVIIKSSNLDFELNNVGQNTMFTSEMLRQMEINGIKIYFEHNVKAATVAERALGVLKNQNGNCAVLYLGTGLGVSFWLDGRLYRGKSNAAGQLGHIKTNYFTNSFSENRCSCGDQGCLEQNIRDLFENNISVKESTGKELAIWLDANEDAKIALVNYLSKAIFNISSLLEIDCVVFSGKLSELYHSIENLFQEKMIQNDQANMYVATSTLGEYSASIGTAICGYYNLIESSVD